MTTTADEIKSAMLTILKSNLHCAEMDIEEVTYVADRIIVRNKSGEYHVTVQVAAHNGPSA
jgi:hypothetical protein